MHRPVPVPNSIALHSTMSSDIFYTLLVQSVHVWHDTANWQLGCTSGVYIASSASLCKVQPAQQVTRFHRTTSRAHLYRLQADPISDKYKKATCKVSAVS